MTLWLAVVLALVQALTEFLPVSSSGHLGLAGFFFGFAYQGLTFDLALHVGTLLAIVAYFRRDLAILAVETLKLRRWRDATPTQRLGVGIALSTIPAAIVGASMPDAFTESLRHPLLIATHLIVFGLLLGWAEARGRKTRVLETVGPRTALAIGAAQALALVPGTSRSGITMTVGLALGLTREAAARYSFLMAVPITVLACAHGALSWWKGSEVLEPAPVAIGVVVSMVAGVAVIHGLLAVLRRAGTMPFVVYRVLLGLVVFAVWFARN